MQIPGRERAERTERAGKGKGEGGRMLRPSILFYNDLPSNGIIMRSREISPLQNAT